MEKVIAQWIHIYLPGNEALIVGAIGKEGYEKALQLLRDTIQADVSQVSKLRIGMLVEMICANVNYDQVLRELVIKTYDFQALSEYQQGVALKCHAIGSTPGSTMTDYLNFIGRDEIPPVVSMIGYWGYLAGSWGMAL